ncbi:MAG: SGNH/GDSL hydrolase family protein [Planctomycetes bacterium]|nr:SGNH/GDSL hydrolase family protein [Planctomycetota bacterium]
MRIPPRRARRLLFGISIGLVSLLVAVFVADRVIGRLDLFGVNYPKETLRWRTEMTELRLYRPDGTLDLDGELFAQKPNVTVEFGSFTIAVNSLGFRGPEIAKQKPTGTYRVLALGDSVTLGWGVNDDVTFVRRLERALNAQGGGRRFEVVNTGHLMYDTTQELALLRDRGLALDPDLVLLTFVVNDIEPTRDLAEALLRMQAEPPQPPTGIRPWLQRRFAEWLPSLHSLWEHYSQYAVADSAPAADGPVPRPEDSEVGKRGWERSKAALLEIRDLCAARGIPLLVLDHTLPPIPSLPEFCAEHGIACHDLRFTPEEGKLPMYNSVRDPHANALGNQLLYEKLRRALKDAGLFDLR